MTATTDTDIPDGFERHFRQSPLTDPWEPLYSKRTDKAVIVGLRLAKPHTNAHGLIHGGPIATLADNAMGYSCAHQLGWTSYLATIGLAVDFIGTAQVGQWLAVEPDQDRQHDLLCAKFYESRRRRHRARQCDVPRRAPNCPNPRTSRALMRTASPKPRPITS